MVKKDYPKKFNFLVQKRLGKWLFLILFSENNILLENYTKNSKNVHNFAASHIILYCTICNLSQLPHSPKNCFEVGRPHNEYLSKFQADLHPSLPRQLITAYTKYIFIYCI